MIQPEHWLAISAVIVALVSATFTWFGSRRRVEAQINKWGAETEKLEAETISVLHDQLNQAWKEVQSLKGEIQRLTKQLKTHNYRWRLMREYLNNCVQCPLEVPTKAKNQLAELQAINDLADSEMNQ